MGMFMPKTYTFRVEITTTKESEHLGPKELRDAIDDAICFWVEEGQGPHFRDENGNKVWVDWEVIDG